MSVPNGLNPQFEGAIGSARSTDVAAGGTTLLNLGATGFVIAAGSGAPTLSAVRGSLYLRTDGSTTATRLYINSTGATAWVAITTAS